VLDRVSGEWKGVTMAAKELTQVLRQVRAWPADEHLLHRIF
jgi:hypothetical protein